MCNDAGYVGKFLHKLENLRDLQTRGLPRGYFPEQTKSILVLAPRNLSRAEEFFCGMGIKVVTGKIHPGGFNRESKAEKRWMARKFTGWAESVETLVGVYRKHPKSAYAGLQKLLQQEWEFMQRVTPDIRDTFSSVEKALRETVVTALFQGLG